MNTTAVTTNGKPAAPPARMTLANIVRGRIDKPIRAVLYGVEGCGKSTFAAAAPNPIFLCAEDGTSHLDIARFPTPRSFADALEAVRVLTQSDHDFKTLAVDTLDWLEPLVWSQTCAAGGKASIEDFGYGKGYVAALDLWRSFLDRLAALERNKKMNVVLLAHAIVKRTDDPDKGSYDRFQMKLHEKASAVVREWADAVLFARHDLYTSTNDKTKKTRGVSNGKRLLFTQWNAAYDAKNRYSLPDKLPLDWQEFADAVKAGAPAVPAKIREEITALIEQLPEAARAKVVAARDEWAGDNAQRLAQVLDKVRAKIALAEDESAGPAAEVAE